ncbi:MAG: aspartate-semialdehyde dehydrogenase [Kiritimatiellae bacterium]|nr:aspartate-semialdehyde dehydrogenase [Kiritimatiellia bacterium]
MKQYKVGLVGIGTVGTEMIKVLRERKFPCSEIRVLATRDRDQEIAGETFHVRETKAEAFDGLDIVLFAGTEGAKGASKLWGWEAVKRGAVVIDNSADFRQDDRVPLVIPEINAEALDKHQGFIAVPNCSTIITLMGLAPLIRAVPIKHFTAVTFQSVSGAGHKAIDELSAEVQAYRGEEKIAYEPTAFADQIAFNVIPQIGGEKADMPGYTSEEAKMLIESRKILGIPDIKVSCTCVRVPVFYAHSIAIHAQFAQPITPEMARDIIRKSPGVKLVDDLAKGEIPMPIHAGHTDDVQVGRIRIDPCVENGLALFCSGDNIRKGAALNAVQIAETLIQRNLI